MYYYIKLQVHLYYYWPSQIVIIISFSVHLYDITEFDVLSYRIVHQTQ